MVQQLDAFPKPRAIRKDAGKPRPKKYPGKWGHGTLYWFDDARAFVTLGGRPWYKRIGFALEVLFGGRVTIDGGLLLISAQGAQRTAGAPVADTFPLNGSEGSETACALDASY